MNHTDLLKMCWNRDVEGFTEIQRINTKTISLGIYRQNPQAGILRQALVFAWGPTKGQPFPNPTPDWISNLKFWQKPILPALPFKAWATAVDEYREVERTVRSAATSYNNDRLVFTGFSQGASIAMVAAFAQWCRCLVVTFASPACFNRAACEEWMESGTLYLHKDYTIATDPIRKAMPWILGYRRTPAQQLRSTVERMDLSRHALLPYLVYVANAPEREEQMVGFIERLKGLGPTPGPNDAMSKPY